MRKIKDEFRQLDYVFAHEPAITDAKIINVITTSYATARERENPSSTKLLPVGTGNANTGTGRA